MLLKFDTPSMLIYFHVDYFSPIFGKKLIMYSLPFEIRHYNSEHIQDIYGKREHTLRGLIIADFAIFRKKNHEY